MNPYRTAATVEPDRVSYSLASKASGISHAVSRVVSGFCYAMTWLLWVQCSGCAYGTEVTEAPYDAPAPASNEVQPSGKPPKASMPRCRPVFGGPGKGAVTEWVCQAPKPCIHNCLETPETGMSPDPEFPEGSNISESLQ